MKMLPNFSRRQWLTLIIIGLADFCNAICVSLQSPFFPKEAEEKGCTATEYGLVFGIFELVVFIISPIYGRHIHKVGPKKMFNIGIFTSAISAILFGLLDSVPGHYPFISLAFIIRIVEALGNAAFLTASFSIIAKEFPNNIATTFVRIPPPPHFVYKIDQSIKQKLVKSSNSIVLYRLPCYVLAGIAGDMLRPRLNSRSDGRRNFIQFGWLLPPLCRLGHFSANHCHINDYYTTTPFSRR